MQGNGIDAVTYKGLVPWHKGKGESLEQPLDTLVKKENFSPSAIHFRWHDE